MCSSSEIMITLRKVFENHRHASGSEKETPNHFSNCQPQIFVVRLASVSTFFGNMVAANGPFTSPAPWLYSIFEVSFSNNIFKDLQHSSNMDATGSSIQKAVNFHLRQQCPPSQMLLFQARNHERLSDGRAGCLFCS